jgi:hypothetical protein
MRSAKSLVFGFSVGVAALGFGLVSCGVKDGPLQNGAVVSDGSLGIRSFHNLVYSYATATGVPVSNTNVKNFYNGAKSRLSLDGNPETVSAAMLLATTALAGVFCQEFIQIDAAKAAGARLVHNGVDFTKGQAFLTPELRLSVIQGYGELFWRRAPTAEEAAILVEALAEAEAGRAQSTTELRNLLRVVCAAAASSFEAIQH